MIDIDHGNSPDAHVASPPSISQARGGMFTAMITSSKTRAQTARKTVIGRRSADLSTSPTSGTTCRTSIRQVHDHHETVINARSRNA